VSPDLLIVTTTFPRWRDDAGAAPFVFHLARALTADFNVTVLAPHAPGAAAREDLDGVRVRRFRYAPGGMERLTDGAGIMNNLRRGWAARLAAPLLFVGEAAALWSALREPFAAVNCHWLVPSGILGALFAGRRPLVVTCHAADYDLLARLPGGGAVIRFIARRATIVAVSPRLADGIAAAAPGARVVTLPMGVDAARFRFREEARREWRERLGVRDEKLILFAGKLSPKKGLPYLLEAAASMPERPMIVVAGDGDERAALERLASEMLPGRARFLGAAPNAELARLYSAADAVALPSVRDERGETEGMPVVALEALAAGRPVVATTLCSLPRELLGRGATEVPPGAASALASALSAALAGPPAAADAVADYDWPRVAARYAELLKEKPA